MLHNDGSIFEPLPGNSTEASAPQGLKTTLLQTTLLRNDTEISQSLSRVVVDTLKLSAAVTTGPLHLNRFGVLAVAVLISIPMWLLIILLSPLHAFVAAKAASAQMSIH